jgi:hypothetical protein
MEKNRYKIIEYKAESTKTYLELGISNSELVKSLIVIL